MELIVVGVVGVIVGVVAVTVGVAVGAVGVAVVVWIGLGLTVVVGWKRLHTAVGVADSMIGMGTCMAVGVTAMMTAVVDDKIACIVLVVYAWMVDSRVIGNPIVVELAVGVVAYEIVAVLEDMAAVVDWAMVQIVVGVAVGVVDSFGVTGYKQRPPGHVFSAYQVLQ